MHLYEMNAEVVYTDRINPNHPRNGHPASVIKRYTEGDGQGYFTGYRIAFADGGSMYAYEDELKRKVEQDRDYWRALAERNAEQARNAAAVAAQHERQRDEAMRQRDALRNELATACDRLAQAEQERDDLRAHAAQVEEQRDAALAGMKAQGALYASTAASLAKAHDQIEALRRTIRVLA